MRDPTKRVCSAPLTTLATTSSVARAGRTQKPRGLFAAHLLFQKATPILESRTFARFQPSLSHLQGAAWMERARLGSLRGILRIALFSK
ncbi:hypothetical protein TNCT_311711 [Trichonephila clavata]|uniref:Uncharacterized protein n=1 Tax=Trichonephila clavata TaxID=2740835 RepID=A0A8X6FDS0_TRICU|nr:hypothetical protein TNCT_311711 [Trichonephila clavata]